MKHTEYIIPIGEDAEDYDEMFIGVIRRHPELVRCKDCKYYRRNDRRSFIRGSDCSKEIIDTIVPDRDFCSKAERKEE